MANHKSTAWVVHEREGPHIVRGFTTEEDAKSFLAWEESQGRLLPNYYSVKPVIVEDCSRPEV